MRTSVEIGASAEQTALRFMKDNDYRMIEANYHSRFGEIDLIMTKANTLVFIEVRYRADTSHGTPLETITPSKTRKIIRTAEYFLLRNPQLREMEFRFDVISISEELDWIKGAFTLDT